MVEMKVRCNENSAMALPYVPGQIYDARDIGGVLEIQDSDGGQILAPLDGHYLKFEIVTEKKK